MCSLPFFEFNDGTDSIEQWTESDVQVFHAPAYIPDQIIGTRLGDFLIQERIGSGGMARVYLAIDSELKRYVAVKLIQNRRYVSLDTQAMLLKTEAVSQASIHHPNVVSIYHIGSHEGLPYLAMEYVDCGSLKDRINDDGLEFEEIVCYTRQIISGLSEAYRIGLVHGDIKPANLLIDDCGHIKLSDFGLARHVSDENSVSKMLVGTPAFMAPELFELYPTNETSDLFSLGVTLYQMTFGRLPYTLVGETVEELKLCMESAKIEMPEEWPEKIPNWWKNILVRMLEKDPDQRYQTIAELESDLEFQISKPAAAKPVPKLSSFFLENVLFGFLCLPLLGLVTGVIGDLGALGTSIFITSAFAGPICFVALTGKTGRTAGQLISHTRLSEEQAIAPAQNKLIKYQLLQLLPIICMLCGALLIPILGPSAALTMISCGMAIAVCHAIDVVSRPNQATFIERACRLQTVVDV